MTDKKTLMTADVKEFLASMNPKKECKRKSSPTDRTRKGHHEKRGMS